jgi:hypothetical protein
MKSKTVLKSLDDLSPEVIKLEPDKTAPAHLDSTPARLWGPRHVPLPVREWKHSDPVGYQHWGLNE